MASQREICRADPNDPNCRSYNILVLEAANSMGFMTSEFVNFLEKVAYYAAHDLYCINRPTEKIAMPELFDLIAGSETGAIIAATLVIPNEDPKT
jgi:hypothetical protein